MREEHRTGLIRGCETAVLQFGIVTLGAYQTTSDWSGALVAGGLAGLIAIATFWGMGVKDARRNDEAEGS